MSFIFPIKPRTPQNTLNTKSKPIQKSLSQFLKKPKNDGIPRYFHFDGKEAQFYSVFPSDLPYREISQIKWRWTKKLLTLTADPQILDSDIFTTHHISPNLDHISPTDQWTPQEEIEIIAILKSHLQKAIRRKQTSHAVSTVHYLATLSPNELLRRIPIIMIEDVSLQPTFPLLVWIMIYYSTKERQISLYWQNFLTEIVRQLCDSNFQDLPDYEKYPPSEIPTPKSIIQTLTDQQKTLLFSLQLRKSFGGMKCDQKMIDSLTLQWLDRFKDPRNSLEDSMNRINKQELIRPLTKDHFTDAAIDFHPCPWLITEIVKKYPNLDSNDVKTAIWQCQSSINLRNNSTPTTTAVNHWNMIQDQVSQFIHSKKEWLFERLTDELHPMETFFTT